MKDINYMKFGNTRLDLLDDGISIDEGLSLTFKSENHTVEQLSELFSNLEDGPIIYGCIDQGYGKETDEFIAGHYSQYTLLDSIIDNENGTYTVKLAIPIEGA